MPERETAWVESVRSHAQAAGWEHRLWDWPALSAAYGDEPIYAVLKRAVEEWPQAFSYTLAADYYRLRVLADGGGLYLDADFSATGWPEFPQGVDIGVVAEFFAARPFNGVFLANKPEPFALAARMAAERLLDKLDAGCAQFGMQLVEMVRRDKGCSLPANGVGPRWVCREVLPMWRAHGFTYDFLPQEAVGHRQWTGTSALTHWGAAHWHEGGRDAAYWEALSARAAEQARKYAIAKLPPHLRPSAGCILPARKVAPPMAGRQAAQQSAPFHIPAGVKRIVVLSNVVDGFPWHALQLRSTDLIIHCNHARHREEAMQVQGTRNWLFVRHGRGRDPRGWHWYHPSEMDGFEKVIFVDDTHLLAQSKWMADFRKLSKKSPTTGFIVANMMREIEPTMPLVLAGFDPGVNHGTPQWVGHAWDVERAWYKQRDFTLLPPTKQPHKILVLVISCHHYERRTIRAKDADGCYQARRACRLAWMRELLPHNMQAFFIVGQTSEPIHEPRVVQVEAQDDYWALPQKVLAGMRWALKKHDFDFIVKVDDDTFIHPERLARYVATLEKGTPDIHGGEISADNEYLSGGAGYILSRRMVEVLVEDPLIPQEGREDVEICEAVLRAGGKIVKDRRFNSKRTPFPQLSNDIISAHYMTPAYMRQAHTDCFLL